ncbi:DNA-binding SARP family transcriptional activator/tetratricopeptide (TPR) repeat protein [Streptomyces umbrinus]|uniref:DNA-binding SARP family transcriptional activator/tetratricopeptide (TPR) repeat protein n=1 Tax=Streptomyces umbrinus TaxID=67370 RepID=A0ABU0SXM4_9ACTN|nr:DNA-binding SARP family transcriptional activator/tetratricopeptide (TPR) repeat protein [Streptomyces umbrinus]
MLRSGLRFGLLGPTVVYDADGVPRPVSSAKGRVLLTALLLEPGRVVSVDVLKDALWGGTPPASAHASLQNHVTRLRRLLDDPDRLRSVPPGYQLRVSEGELDVRLFETRIGAARAAHARRDWERAVTEAMAALGLWRGTPLTGMPPGLGGLSLVQRLEEARLFALECRYDAELELGRGVSDGDVRLSGLAPELAALVAEFPLREAFHRQLMMVLHRTGRRAEALAVHRDLRRTLVRELGVEPGLAVREAHLEILRDEDSGTGAGAGTGAGGGAEAGSGSRSGPGPGSGSGPGSRSGPASAAGSGPGPGSGSGPDASARDETGAAETTAPAEAAAPAETAAPAGRQAIGGDGVSAPLPAESASTRTDPDPRGADHPPSAEAAHAASAATAAPDTTSAPVTPSTPGIPATPAPPKGPVLVPVPRPAQLPPAPLCFTGRAETIGSLRATLVPAGDGHPRVAVVSGMAGVGKSALGVQVAHGLRAEFPDGQLYVRLHGATPGVPPLTVGQALAALLRDLGVEPRGAPEHPDAASALLRSLLAPTRTLLVLDDAVNAAQVRPLLPAGPGCAVIVTSRSPLTALDGVTRFPLAPLSDEESAELLRAVSGRDGLDGTHPLVGLTGRLPLALRIVAARLAARQVLTPDALAGQLAASDGRLHHLEYDDLSVRRSLAVALDALRASDREADRDAARALHRIGALDLPTYGVPLLARLLGTGERRTEGALDRLVDVALLDETAYGRYAPHDLVRDFAREVAREAAEGEAPGPTDSELTASVPTGSSSTDPDPTDIALHWYIASARRCVPALIPSGVDRDNRLGTTPAESERSGATGSEAVPFATAAEAVAWGDREVANVVALVEGHAAASPLIPVLVRALFPYLQRRGRLRELSVLGRRALKVARLLGDDAAEAIALSDLAGLYFMQGQAGKALVLTDQALTRWRGLGVVSRIQRCLNNRGLLLESLGRYVECELALRESLELARELGDLDGEAVAYSNLGNLYEHSDPRAAIEWHERSLALGETMGDSRVRESGHCNIGYAHLTLGEPARALEHFDRALSVSDGVDWQSGSQTRLGLVRALRGLDRTERAARECALLLARAELRADRYTAGLARHQQGLLHRSAGRNDEAYEQWELALDDLDGTDSTVTDELRELLLIRLNGPSLQGS